jgi:hypothetical protein
MNDNNHVLVSPDRFEMRKSIYKVHRANASILTRFALADEQFADTHLKSGGGNAFETQDDALREEAHHIVVLFNERAHKTAGELQQARTTDTICATFSSAVFSRLWRMMAAQRLLYLLKPYELEAVKRLTIISQRWCLKPDELNVQALANVKKKMRRILDDAGMTALDGLVFGQLDLEFDGTHYWPHFHLMVAGDKLDAAEPLRDILRRHSTPDCRHTLVVEDIAEIGGAATYCMKAFCKMRIRTQLKGSSKSKRAPKAQRLPPHHEAQWLKVMHRVRVSDVLLLQGLRLGRDGLNLIDRGAEL